MDLIPARRASRADSAARPGGIGRRRCSRPSTSASDSVRRRKRRPSSTSCFLQPAERHPAIGSPAAPTTSRSREIGRSPWTRATCSSRSSGKRLSLPHAEAGAHEHADSSRRDVCWFWSVAVGLIQQGCAGLPPAAPPRDNRPARHPGRRRSHEEIIVTQPTPEDTPPPTPSPEPPRRARACGPGPYPIKLVGDPRRLARLRQETWWAASRSAPRRTPTRSRTSRTGEDELLEDLAWFWDQAAKDAAAAAQYVRDKSQAT